MKRFFFRKREMPLSFLAFQDIITALAGTMLLLVLLIGLHKSHSANSSTAPATASRQEYEELLRQTGIKRSNLARERQKLENLRKKFDEQAQAAADQMQSKRLAGSIRQMEQLIRQRQQMLQKLQKELQNLQKAPPCTPEEKKLLALLEKYHKSKLELHKVQLEYTLLASDRKENILLDCSRSCWVLSRRDRPPRVLGAAYEAFPELLKYLRKHDPAASCLIISVRPSAGGFIQALKKSLKNEFPKLEIIAEPLVSESAGGLKL